MPPRFDTRPEPTELVIREKPGSVYFWAGACLLLGLGLGALNPLGFLMVAGGVVLGIRALRSWQGKEALKIDSAGFTVSTLFRETRESWADIEAFKVLTYSYLGFIPIRRMVVYRYTPRLRKSALRKAVGWINGWDAQLPGNFGMKAQELAALLEECRRRFTAAAPLREKAS